MVDHMTNTRMTSGGISQTLTHGSQIQHRRHKSAVKSTVNIMLPRKINNKSRVMPA